MVALIHIRQEIHEGQEGGVDAMHAAGLSSRCVLVRS